MRLPLTAPRSLTGTLACGGLHVMNFWRRSLAIALLLVLASGAGARTPGTTAADFLVLYSDARPAALAGAYTALSDDAGGMAYNPAGLIRSSHREITASYLAWFESMRFQHLAYTHPLGGGLDAAGISLLHFDPGGFERTNELGLSTFEQLEARDLAVSVGYGRKIGRYWAAGVTAKYIHRRLYRYDAGTWAADLGLLYWTPVENLVVGASVQNLGPSMTFLRDREPLPTTYRAGVAWNGFLENLTILADAVKVIDQDAYVALGIEGRLVEAVSLRGGWRSEKGLVEGWTVGVGLEAMGVALDYAYVPYEELGGTHRFTGTVKFGGPRATPEVYRLPRSSPSEEPAPVFPEREERRPEPIRPEMTVTGADDPQ